MILYYYIRTTFDELSRGFDKLFHFPNRIKRLCLKFDHFISNTLAAAAGCALRLRLTVR